MRVWICFVVLVACGNEQDPELLDRLARIEERVARLEARASEQASTNVPVPNPTPAPVPARPMPTAQLLGALVQAEQQGDTAAAQSLRTQLQRSGSNEIGNLLIRGDCPGAQQLYEQLVSAEAESTATQHFTTDWCPLPSE